MSTIYARESLRRDAEREMTLWVARFVGDSRHGKLSRIEALALADAALEERRRREVTRLKDSHAGRAEAAQLEREDAE